MNNVTMNIIIIGLIFVVGLTLCITQSVIMGIVFILLANFALPSLLKLTEADRRPDKKFPSIAAKSER